MTSPVVAMGSLRGRCVVLTAAFLAALCATLCVTVPALAAPDKNDAASAKKTQDVASGGEEAKAPAKKKATKKKATKKKATKKKATKKKTAKKRR